jgi:hypothetical protein
MQIVQNSYWKRKTGGRNRVSVSTWRKKLKQKRKEKRQWKRKRAALCGLF